MIHPGPDKDVITLLARLKEGDQQAAEILFEQIDVQVKKWHYSSIRERHPEVKVELVLDTSQNAMVKIKGKLEQFKGTTEGSFWAWCYRLAIHSMINDMKKYVRNRQREVQGDELPEPKVSKSVRPDEALAKRRLLLMVREAVDSIPNPNHKDAIFLFFFEELKQKEIAELKGVTETLVSSWVMRGKEKVEEYIQQRYGGEFTL